MEPDVGLADGLEFLRDGSAGVKRAVAIGAEMAEIKIFHGPGDNFGGHFRSRIVGEMAVAGKDALLDRPGALRVFLKEP